MLNKLKDDILRLLKEDEEFRYAVIGLLGLQRLEEAVIELKNVVVRMEERLAKVEERQTKVEERLEEHDRKFNEIIAELRDLRRVSNEHTVMLRNMQGMMIHGFAQMGKIAGISLESLVRSILTNVMRDNGELPRIRR
jgi:uncharacterized protein YhaN